MIDRSTTREEWLAKRRLAIGGSDAPVVLGLQGSPLALWAEKLGLEMKRDEDDEEEPEWLEIGREIEAPIAKIAARRAGRELIDLGAYTIIRSEESEHIACSPDRLVVDKEKGLGVLQIKNVGWMNARKWKEEPPESVLAQNQHELYVCQTSKDLIRVYGEPKFGMVAALLGGNHIVWMDQEPNARFVKMLLKIEAEFWVRVQDGTPPDPKGTEYCGQAIAALYPADNGTVIEIGGTNWDLVNEYDSWCEAFKVAEQRKELLSQQIKVLIGEAARATLPDGTGFSYLTTPAKEITPKPYTRSAFRTLRRIGLKRGGK